MTTDQMRVIEMTGPGAPDVLVEARRPIPVAAPGEVLIGVAASGVNGPDILQRRGLYPPPEGASDLLGLEVSGTVLSVGEGVARWAVGDEVCALTNGGGYAECVSVDADHCLALPPGLALEDAAGLPETFFTVWSNLFFRHPIVAGGHLLVQGGAGGIGSTAIQLGRALGLKVFATANGPDACAYCESLGAYRAIDYNREDFVDVLREAGGADLVLDILGGAYVARHIKAARADARIVSLAFRTGSKVEVDLMPMMLKRLTLTGSTLRPRPPAFKADVARDLEEKVWPHFADGRIRPVTHAVMPLSDAARAHEAMEASRHRGKLLLKP